MVTINLTEKQKIDDLCSGHYRATVTCANCETPNSLVIPKGRTVAMWLQSFPSEECGVKFMGNRPCLYCGCELEDIDFDE